MSNSYTTSIVIPNYKRPDLLEKLLNSLSQSRFPVGFQEIIVVENGPVAVNEKLVENFTTSIPVKYIFHAEASVSAARNLGIAASSSDIVLFFDDDITVSAQCLCAYQDAFDRYGLEHFYGGRLKADYEDTPDPWLIELLPESAKGFSLDADNPVVENQFFLGGNFAVPKGLLKLTDGFDPFCPVGESNEGFSGEETRLQQKLYSLGYKGAYVNDAVIWHYVPQERCSKSWLLQRKHREGQGYARAHISELKASKSIAGIPLWIISKLAKLYVTEHTQLSSKTRFQAKAAIKYYLGIVTGLRDKEK